MKKLAWLMCCSLACAHESKGVGGENEAKTQGTMATEAAKKEVAPQAPVPAATPVAVPPVAVSPPDGKIPLSATPEAAELLRRGYDALFITNIDVALGFYKKALELDPKFLVAQAFLYTATPGTESMHKVEDATKAGAGLPEAERTLLEWVNAGKHGDQTTVVAKSIKLLALAPKDPIAHLAVAQDELTARKLDDALAEFQKASDLDPRLGAPYSLMSFIFDVQGKRDDEVAVLRRWVATRPDDPAAEQALAGGLMATGKFDEAADAARKATTMAGAGWDSWLTLAYVDEMRGDWMAARGDLAKGYEQAQSGVSRAAVDEQMAFVDLARHDQSAAAADLDAMAKDAADGQDPNDVVRANIDRAVIQLAGGKLNEAVKTAQQAADRIANEAVSDVARGYLSREALTVAVWVDAAAKKPAAAADALARLEKASPDVGKDAGQDDGLAWARGEVAWVKGDVKSAVEQFSKCIVEDDLCRYRLAAAQEKAGDKAAAAATRAAILDARHGNKFALLVRAWLTEPPKAAKRKKVASG